MTPISTIEILEAAAYALVGERCRESYLHDLRGGVQGIQSAVELLARVAATSGESPGMVEKASALARRAVQNQEKSLAELVNQLVPFKEPAGTVNVTDLMAEALRFLRNEAAAKPVTFNLQAEGAPAVAGHPHKFRLLVIGLCAGIIDAAFPGARVDVKVARVKSDAMIEFRGALPRSAVQSPEDLLRPGGMLSCSYGLLLGLTQRWVSCNGGRLEAPAESDLPSTLRIYYPLANSNTNAAPAPG